MKTMLKKQIDCHILELIFRGVSKYFTIKKLKVDFTSLVHSVSFYGMSHMVLNVNLLN